MRIPALVLLLALALVAMMNTAMPMPVSGAIAQRGSATTATTTGTSLTIGIPTGVATGDVLIVNIAKVGNNTTAPSSAGWTLIDGRSLGGMTLRYGAVLYRVADGTEGANVTFALGTGTNGAVGSIVAFSGVDVSGPTPFDVAPGTISVQPNQTAVVAASITTASANAAVIMFGMAANSAPTWSGWTTTSPGALIELYDNQKTTGSQASVGAAWGTKATVGATGAGAATLSAAQRNGGILVALKPAVSNPVPTTTSISPTSKTVGDAEFTLTVNGTNFVSGASVVRLDGADRATAFVSATQLTAMIPASDLTTGGDKSITVFTSAPGGGISNAQTLTVNKMTPTITWDNPADIVYGTALSSTQLCATASVPGTFLYTPDFGAMLLAGSSQTLHVDFTPTDTAIYYNASADVNINVNKATLIIAANNINKTYGAGATFAGTEFAADGLVKDDTVTSVTLASTGAGVTATVDNSPYSIVPSAAVGTGLSNYNITYVDGSLTVDPRALTITANNLSKIYRAAATFIGTGFTADGLVNGDTVASVTLASAGATADARVDGSPYPIVPSAAIGTGLSNYSIIYVNGSLTVNKATVGLSLTSSASTSTKGRSVFFTGTFTDTGATGTVTFQDGETMLGSSTVVDGMATYTVSTLIAGRHSIAAVYSGDANFAGSTSSALDLTVKRVAGSYWWAMIGGLIALDVLLGLLLLVLILRRRRKHPSGANTISGATGVAVGDTGKNHGGSDPESIGAISSAALAAGDASMSQMALPTVEDVGTYTIQLERELERSLQKVSKSMEAAIQAICRTVETRDAYVAGHQKRVSQLACTIAKEMGLTAWQIEGIRVAGLLHDIGKITVPTEILSKPGRLSGIEVTMIKDHPKVAFDILKNIEFEWPIARIVVQHHERMDGSGYPYGLKGEDILLEARILGVADVVEAMSSDRPYRPARGIDEALAELARGEGTLYDPAVVRACATVIRERGFKVELTSSHT